MEIQSTKFQKLEKYVPEHHDMPLLNMIYSVYIYTIYILCIYICFLIIFIYITITITMIVVIINHYYYYYYLLLYYIHNVFYIHICSILYIYIILNYIILYIYILYICVCAMVKSHRDFPWDWCFDGHPVMGILFFKGCINPYEWIAEYWWPSPKIRDIVTYGISQYISCPQENSTGACFFSPN